MQTAKDIVKMTKKNNEIKTDYFFIEGYKFSITFIPNGDKKNYQVMNEHTHKVYQKGKVDE